MKVTGPYLSMWGTVKLFETSLIEIIRQVCKNLSRANTPAYFVTTKEK
jgi:hypothetical protein